MVPEDFVTYFSTMAAVGGTLFGLIFITVSIAPETFAQKNAPIGRQVRAAGSYNALLNPLVISLFALIPHGGIPYVTLVMSTLGIINTLVMAISIIPHAMNWREQYRNLLFILGGLVLYGFEAYYGVRLVLIESDVSALDGVASILILIYLFGLARAWDLIGVRQFHVQDLLTHRNSEKE